MSEDQRTDLPPVGSPTFDEKVREAISTYLGKRGDRLDRGVTLRDLTDAGIAELRDGYLSGNKGTRVPIYGPGSSVEPVYEPDLTPPPTPTNFSVSSAITHLFAQHDTPAYTIGHGHARTYLYGKLMAAGDPLPLFTAAQRISEFTGAIYAYPTTPATTWRLWCTWVSVDGVESVYPAGGANGLEVTTGQDVSLLLDALNGQISTSELNTALNTRINLVDSGSGVVGSVDYRIASEATIRAAAVAAEQDERVRTQTVEARLRTDQVKASAEAMLRDTLSIDKARLAKDSSVTAVRQEMSERVVAGLSAEAALRTTLETKVDTNNTSALAAIASEATARSTGDAAEATQRNLLATQFRGTYTGNDVNAVTEGLIYQERVARAAQDSSLAQQITLLSAGSGEQFDWKAIWYFDSGVEGWTGNGTPTVTSGFLRPANQTSGAYVASPTGVAVDGNTYSQVRLRVRKVGAPTWGGFVYWRSVSDSTWDVSRRVTLIAPTFDSNGIGLVTVTTGWAVTVDTIRVDLSSAQTATDYYELDWAAIGRPSPGASSAQITDEQTARIAGDAAVAATVTTLSAQVNNATTGLPATYAGLTTEASTRAAADTALSGTLTTLTSRVTTAEGDISANASAITAEATTRATDVSALATTVSGLSSTVGDPATGLAKTRADLLDTQNTVATSNSATSRSLRELFSSAGDIDAAALRAVLAGDTIRAVLSRNLASASEQLTTNIVTGLSSEATARLALAAVVDSNAAAISTEATARATADSALATSISALSTTVGTNTSAITSEATTRANADSALSTSITTLSSQVNNATTGLPATYAAIGTEATTRANADSALSTSVTTLSSQVNNPTTGLPAAYTAISTEATTRANQTGDLFAQYTVKLDVNGYVSGFGLASTLTNATPFSQFIFKADQFAFGAPGQTSVYPFVIQASATTVNGVAVPTGVYIDAAYIKNGTITTAKIGDANISTAKIADLAVSTAKIADANITTAKIADANITTALIADANITTAKIADANITTAKIADANITTAKIAALAVTNAKIGGTIQSDAFVSGSAGWAIGKDGTAQFNTGTFRGAVNVGSFTGYAWPAAGLTGAHLSSSGFLVGNPNTVNGKYFQIATDATGASIYTNIPAYLADAQVTTLKIAGNAVTFAVGVYSATPYASPDSTAEQTLLTAVITTSGAPVMILAGLEASANTTNTTTGGTTVTFRIRRDGNQLQAISINATNTSRFVGTPSFPPIRDVVAAGTHTYTLTLQRSSSSSNSNSGSDSRGLLVMEIKK